MGSRNNRPRRAASAPERPAAETAIHIILPPNRRKSSLKLFGNLCGDNGCLWILILLLIVCCSQSGILSNILDSCYLPLILAVAYCACKKGGLCNLFRSGCGCK